MVLAVVIVPKPEAIDPLARAPVPVMAVVTASVTSSKAASLPSRRLSSVVSSITPLKTKVVPELPVRVIAPVVLPMDVVLAAVAPSEVVPVIVSPAVPWISPAPAVRPTDVISPEALTVVTPDNAPAVDTSKAVESRAKVLEPPPMVTAPVLVPVFRLVAKLELTLTLTMPPVEVSPAWPVIIELKVLAPAIV